MIKKDDESCIPRKECDEKSEEDARGVSVDAEEEEKMVEDEWNDGVGEGRNVRSGNGEDGEPSGVLSE